MARPKKPPSKTAKKPIAQYEHPDKTRKNNPPVGLVTPETDQDSGKKRYAYDPHLDPQLVWAGKAEHTSFEIPTVSLHVHERIDPRTIIDAVRKRNGNGQLAQLPLFESPVENPPLRDAIDFYKHDRNWSNRLIAGDSLLVMNSLLEKEGMAGQVQMIYIDPPYGIRYGSNFQPFVNKRDVKDGKDEDLTAEPEMIRAFRDTWELGIHSYLTYLRDRLLLARELLAESGSCFVQISDENVHLVRNLMDEVFGVQNFSGLIFFLKTSGKGGEKIDPVGDYLLWYGKDGERTKVRPLFTERRKSTLDEQYSTVELPDGSSRRLTSAELRGEVEFPEGRRYMPSSMYSDSGGETTSYVYEFKGKPFRPLPGYYWRTTKEGMDKLVKANRIVSVGNYLRYKMFAEDYPVVRVNNMWADVRAGGFGEAKIYVVQTNTDVVARCLLMATDPGDLVFDPTCGAGTAAYAAEQWGRRWITCDTSRVSIALAKQRLMTALFDYYDLAHPQEGVGSGFRYKKVPHITLKSIANNPEIREGMTRGQIDAAIRKYADEETLYDQPFIDNSKARVTGPFTVEAVPAPAVKSLDDVAVPNGVGAQHVVPLPTDTSIARTGPSLRHAEWRDELLKCGIRGKNGQHILFSRVEPLSGTRWLHAEAETKPNGLGGDNVREGKPEYGRPARVVISFGPEHAPLEQRQVEMAWEEARQLSPKPTLLLFAAFQFDPEAAKDIDELTPAKTSMTFLKVQMNTDLLTEDLKKKRASNESFWLIGQPDVEVRRVGAHGGAPMFQVEVHGFDYYNTKTGAIESGDVKKIAMWMLDPDYDGRSLYPRQVFFPMAGENEGWARLAKNLKAEIDEELIEAYRGTISLPFEPGKHKRVAVKIVDDRGIESLRVVELKA